VGKLLPCHVICPKFRPPKLKVVVEPLEMAPVKLAVIGIEVTVTSSHPISVAPSILEVLLELPSISLLIVNWLPFPFINQASELLPLICKSPLAISANRLFILT